MSSYCFDLDGDEGEGEAKELAHDKFTVDSRLHGMDLSVQLKIHTLNHFV